MGGLCVGCYGVCGGQCRPPQTRPERTNALRSERVYHVETSKTNNRTDRSTPARPHYVDDDQGTEPIFSRISALCGTGGKSKRLQQKSLVGVYYYLVTHEQGARVRVA
jgi:hypothetical protein